MRWQTILSCDLWVSTQCAPRQAGRRLLDAAQAGPSAADLAADAAVQLAQPASATAQVSGPCGLSASV